ncbi:hypothetical protein [Mycolicibacterium moriokaense]|uniref:ASCH domain-containing protein n=1 Tax=Mycolicibacterium moriokaense TaxID=39691 RepID=A0A318HIJ4_9MYCO|nr:hypothetical protein [Mycolicibacterium moriokaense]PXX09742.1 hypothetical protein C8E89_10595 [Mycolicibacterium moriokaense]
MLLNRDTAEGIANGTITLVLRRWDAPRAKPGGTQRTVAGTVRVDDIAEYPGGYRVTVAQARAAGYPDAKTAQKELDRRPAKHTYLISVSYLAPDERPELAADDRLSAADVDAITARLDRWDAAAETHWTREYLEMIGANEAVRHIWPTPRHGPFRYSSSRAPRRASTTLRPRSGRRCARRC